MLGSAQKAKLPTGLRPIVSIRLLYKTFVAHWECFGHDAIRRGTRISPRVQVGRTLGESECCNWSVFSCWRACVWVVSLDLSKTFDRVSWTQLWRTLKAHGVWIIQCLYWQQRETRVRTNFNSEYYPLVALARVPVCPCARASDKCRSPEVQKWHACRQLRSVCWFPKQSVHTEGSYSRCKGRCLIWVLTLVCGIFTCIWFSHNSSYSNDHYENIRLMQLKRRITSTE